MTREKTFGPYVQSVVEYVSRKAGRGLRTKAASRGKRGSEWFEQLESRALLSGTISLQPSQGVFTSEGGANVVTVLPGTDVSVLASLAGASSNPSSFQLDFSTSNSAVVLNGWSTDAAWDTTADGVLASPGNDLVSGSNGSPLGADSDLGTFHATAPSTPGDYTVSANAGTIYSGDLFYTLYINRLKESIEEEQAGVAVTSVNSFTSPNSANVNVSATDYVNVKKVHYTYNAATHVLTFGAATTINQTLGADGIVQSQDGNNLIIGGQANQVFEVSSSAGGPVQTANLPSGESFHLALDPDGTKIWTSDEPGDKLLEVPLASFGTGIVSHTVTGDPITQLAFTPALTALNKAYYTSSNRDGGAGGDGFFGVIDLTTFTTTRAFTVDASHSIVVDPYTGDLMLFGDHTITQVDISAPEAPVVKSNLDVTAQLAQIALNLKITGVAGGFIPLNNFDTGTPLNVMDQGTVDGLGHAIVAVNTGHVVFIDYHTAVGSNAKIENASIVIDPGTNKIPFLENFLDDFSPVVGAGSAGGTIISGPGGNVDISTFTNLVVRVVAPASISGVAFTDSNGNGVQDGGELATSGVTVFLDTNDNGQLDGGEVSTTTNGSGVYSFANLLPNTYHVVVVVPDGQIVTLPESGTYDVTLVAGQDATRDFGLQTPGSASIAGFVFQDRDADATQDVGDDGFPGAEVYLDTNNNGSLDDGESSTLTNGSGAYSFTDLAAGTYHVRVNLPNGYTQSFPLAGAAATLGANNGDQFTGIGFGIYANAHVTGRIYVDNNSNGDLDGGDTAQQGVVVFLDTNSNGTLDDGEVSTTTAPDASYSFSGLVPGTYNIREVVPDGFTRTYPFEGVHSVTLGSGDFLPFQDFTNNPLPTTGSISGTLYNDANSNGKFDIGESVRAGITVFLDTNNNSVPDNGETTTVTDINGQYTFSNVAPGDYIVRHVSPVNTLQTGPDYSIILTGGSQVPSVTTDGFGFGSASLSADGTLLYIEYSFYDLSSSVTLTHIHAGNAGVNGGVAYDLGALFGLSAPISSPVSGTIAFSSSDLTALNNAGLYVNVHTTDNSSGEVRGQIIGDSAYRVHIIAGLDVVDRNFGDHADPGSISGTVFTDTDGDGLIEGGDGVRSGVTVYIDSNSDGTFDNGEPTTQTDAQGNYTLSNLQAGSYKVRQVLAANIVQTFPGTAFSPVTLGETENATGVNFADFNLGVISGTVFNDVDNDGIFDGNETARPGVTLFLDFNSNGVLDGNEPSVVSDAGGLYEFDFLPTGTYRVLDVLTDGHTQSGNTAANDIVITNSGGGISNYNIGDHTALTTATVTGRAFFDTNGNGTFDGGETVRSGAIIYIDVNSNGIADNGEPAVSTQQDGSFTFPDLAPGTYSFRQTLLPNYVQSAPAGNAALTLTVAAGDSKNAGDFGSFLPGSITGAVFDDADSNGVFAVGEDPIQSATVYLDANNNGVNDNGETTTLTDENGVYIFSGLAPGTYHVRQVVDVGITQTLPGSGAYDVAVVSGSSFINKDFGDHTNDVEPHGPNLNGTLDSPGNVIPGDNKSVILHIHNTGDQPATGSIVVQLYDTTNGSIDGLDAIKSMVVSLAGLAAGDSKDVTFSNVSFTSNTLPGVHTLIAVIDANNDIDETNEQDNFPQSDPFNVTWQFGLVPGQAKAIKLAVNDNDGTITNFSMKGSGFGSVTFDPNTNRFGLVVDGTNSKSSVVITSTKSSTPNDDGHADLGDVHILHALGKFDAKTIGLYGSLTADAALTSLSLQDIGDNNLITIGSAEGAANAAVTLTFGHVADSAIESALPIKSLTVLEWADNDSTRDHIHAPSIDKVTSKGDTANGFTGKFEVDLTLTGNPTAGKSALGSATLLGSVAGTWLITGNVGKITAGSLIDDWNADITGNVASITTKIGDMQGDVQANSIKTISLKTDLNNSLITLVQPVSGSLTGLGVLKVGGSIIGSSIVAAGSLGSISAKSMTDSHILAGFNGDIVALPAADGDFNNVNAAIKSVSITGLPDASAPSFINSFIAAGTLTKVALKVVLTDNFGDPFGLVAATLIKSATSTGNAAVSNQNAPGDYLIVEDFVIRVV